MNNQKETTEEKRERLRQNELKHNPTGSLNDAINRGSNGSSTDFSGGMGWKGTGIVVVVLIVGFLLYKMVF